MTASRSWLLLACAAALSTSCSGFYARGYAGYMQPDLQGEVALAPTGGVGLTASASVDNELGLDKESSPYVRAELGASIVSLTVSGFEYDSRGTGTVTADFGVITVGEAVDTETTIRNAKAALTFNVLDIGPVRLSPGVGVDYFDIDMRVTATNINALEELDVQAPVPMVFLQSEVDLGVVAATVDIGGMQASVEDADGTFFDVEALLRLNSSLLWDPPGFDIELFAGYRWISIDADGVADDQPFDVNLELTGFFVGGGLTF